MTAKPFTPWKAHLQTLRRAEADLSAEERFSALIEISSFVLEVLASISDDVDQILDHELPELERRITAKRRDQYGSRVMNRPVAQPVQLSPEILREMADMDLQPHGGDPFWDEMWDEFVAHLGGVPQALKACRERQLAGQHDLRAYVVAAVRSYRRRAEGKAT